MIHSLSTKSTEQGMLCLDESGVLHATIKWRGGLSYVVFPNNPERDLVFDSFEAAGYYALAIAIELESVA